MWIFDSYHKGCVELWGRKRGLVRHSQDYPSSFYLHLKDPASHIEMIEGLGSRYRVEECQIRTIYGSQNGYKIYADRSVAEKIEIQTSFLSELYNVDVRQDQRYMAETNLFPCGEPDESRFAHEFDIPLSCMEMQVIGDPYIPREVTCIEVLSGRKKRLEGSEKTVISDLMELIRTHDPDVILMPYADTWIPLIVQKAKRLGLSQTLSRSGWFKKMASKSYWRYGKTNHKDGALVPEGRVLIDTAKSFVYGEGGLKGIFMAARLSGLSPNMVSRFTPGTLISSYEVFEALRRGIAVPFRKRDPESVRTYSELRACDKGGMIFQPSPGIYEKVHQLDFTSLYPSIIVKYNLSAETIAHPERLGFLSEVLAPLLNLRIEIKRLKKTEPEYAGIDAVLKWMLVTCFGYTGYRNAKFGQIEVHERITSISRELLMQVKEIAEGMGFEVLHGIVDCLWVRGEPASVFKESVERETGIPTELDSYDWLVFLPMASGAGAYNRYFGRLTTGKVKIRGVMARKGDTPEYVREMQQKMFQMMGEARSISELYKVAPGVRDIYKRYAEGLPDADLKNLAIHRRVSRLDYSRRCAEAFAVKAHLSRGIRLSPGMEISYVVRDASRWDVAVERDASEFDAEYYGRLLEKAWVEVAFAFNTGQGA